MRKICRAVCKREQECGHTFRIAFRQLAARLRKHDQPLKASALVEEVLVNENSGQVHTFYYVVWNYTSPAAAAVSHAAGEFVYAADGDSTTNVTWTYAFALKEDRLPGSLGPFGRWLFRVSFLDGGYADLMQQTLLGMKANAEATGPAPDRSQNAAGPLAFDGRR